MIFFLLTFSAFLAPLEGKDLMLSPSFFTINPNDIYFVARLSMTTEDGDTGYVIPLNKHYGNNAYY